MGSSCDYAMSEEQLSALLAKLKEDEALLERLKGAADLDVFLAIAKDAGFDLSKADWLRHQAKQKLQLTDEDLELVAGGTEGRVEQRVVPKQEFSVDICFVPPVT